MPERAQAFIKPLPKKHQKRILAEAEQQQEAMELPQRVVRNPDLRRKRVTDEAQSTPAKKSVLRERSVQVGVAESKAAAKAYLSDQYTNSHGRMICQVCKGELPFKLATGAYYFEAVEVLAESENGIGRRIWRYVRTMLQRVSTPTRSATRWKNSSRPGSATRPYNQSASAFGEEAPPLLERRPVRLFASLLHLAGAERASRR